MNEQKETKIPTIISLGNEQIKNTEDKKQQYYQKYQNGEITLKEIPAESLSTQILSLAIIREPQEFIDIMFVYVKAKIINTNLGYYVNLLPDTFKNQELYNRLFDVKPEQYYKHIPFQFRTKEMAEELVEINPKNIKIILSDHRTEKMFNDVFPYVEKYWLIKHMPEYFKTREMCEMAFSENKESFKYIKDEFKTEKMCFEAVEYNPNLLKLVPIVLLNSEICQKAMEKDISIELFELIPNKFKTKEMCQKAFEKDKQQFKKIPDEYKTQEMCQKAVEYNSNMLKLVPLHLMTQEMCIIAFDDENSKHGELFELIKDEFKTEKMCLKVLKINLSKYAKQIPSNLYQNEILSTIIIELKKLIENKRTIKLDADIYLVIINIYPHMLKAFNGEKVEEIIVNELSNIIEKNITIEDISKKYGISINSISKILEKLKDTDLEKYNKIQEVLNNQKELSENILIEDIINLGNIIKSLDYTIGDSISLEQRIKFAYLSKKYIRNKLEDIYKFNYQIYLGENANRTRNFLANVLRYKVIFKGNIEFDSNKHPQQLTSIFNNGWLDDYSTDKFFGIKDGVPTIINKYGKDEEELTMNIEHVIVEMLKAEEIPLIDVIVKAAFKEYYKDNLFEYIYKLKSYESEMEILKANSKK